MLVNVTVQVQAESLTTASAYIDEVLKNEPHKVGFKYPTVTDRKVIEAKIIKPSK